MSRRTVTWAGIIAVLAILALVLIPGAVLAKKGGGGKPPPDPEPDPDPAIAYTVTKRSITKIMVMNADGSNQTEVYNFGQSSASRLDWSPPGWSPPSAWPESDLPYLAFKSNIQGNGVYVVRLDGEDLRKVIALDSSFHWGGACWSPVSVSGVNGGGKYRIAYVDQLSGNSRTDLFIVDPDGSNRVRLTSSPDDHEAYPTWSPSAKRIAVRRDDSTWGVYDFETSAFTEKSHAGPFVGATVLHPAWSNTQEDKIAWLTNAQNADYLEVWIVDLDAPSTPLRLTNTSTVAERAVSWSSDDSKIAVSCADVKGGKLRNHRFEVMSATDGSSRTKIANASTYPAWKR